ncbi:IS3 family transposase, partial [Aneurinibacillus aneurinilyticus]|uniref:IS3 family transposase n=1 Tax=Aneurinibacillus aneurinilyticus TaxID=1391 RepID=UPI003D219A78
MTIKGQKFKTYSEELKLEAIRLHVEEKWTYRQINDHLGIQDKDRMRKYREQGEFGLLDQRGRRKEYLDQERYVQQLKREKNDRDVKAMRLIRKVYHRYEGKYGYRQLQLFLWQDDGIWMNHKKVLRLMQKLGLQASIRRKRRFNMKDKVAERVAKNLLKRDFTADKPNQKWVTGVTQYRVGERWLYLSAVKDVFNNEIVAYQLSERNDNDLVLQTFTKAFAKQKDVTGLVVHSDQGFQYTSHAYHDMLP